jgi:hypothetical protein
MNKQGIAFVEMGWPEKDGEMMMLNILQSLMDGNLNSTILECLETINTPESNKILQNLQPKNSNFLNPLDVS